MIISISQIKEFINLDGWTDARILHKLKAIESVVRQYTNNNFQDRDERRTADIVGGLFVAEALIPFEIGDTVQISESVLNKGLYTVAEVEDGFFTVEEDIKDERDVLVTKVTYPADVIDCVINLMEWEIKHRQKVGIKSETLSRHSVTYEDSSQMFNGYPVGILNALNLYKKARF